MAFSPTVSTSHIRTCIIDRYTERIMSLDSAVGIATGYRAGRSRGRSSSPGRVKNFHISILFRPATGPTQPSFQ
jgi:hypothetical protein